jgi:hypothetical protein
VVDGWTLSADSNGFPSINKTLTYDDAYDVTVSFMGNKAAIDDILGGNWSIAVGFSEGEELVFSKKNNAEKVRTKDVNSASFSIKVEPCASARQTGIGGSLGTGTYVTMTRDWVWWGMNAWVIPDSGNVDLYLNRLINNSWQQVAMSKNPGQDMDSVADNPGWWWYSYMLKIQCVATSVFHGSVSW